MRVREEEERGEEEDVMRVRDGAARNYGMSDDHNKHKRSYCSKVILTNEIQCKTNVKASGIDECLESTPMRRQCEMGRGA